MSLRFEKTGTGRPRPEFSALHETCDWHYIPFESCIAGKADTKAQGLNDVYGLADGNAGPTMWKKRLVKGLFLNVVRSLDE